MPSMTIILTDCIAFPYRQKDVILNRKIKSTRSSTCSSQVYFICYLFPIWLLPSVFFSIDLLIRPLLLRPGCVVSLVFCLESSFCLFFYRFVDSTSTFVTRLCCFLSFLS